MTPRDPSFVPRKDGFSEVWHAQVLAMAEELIRAGVFSAQDWAHALGAEIRAADARGAADTEDTYYLSALTALEGLCRDYGGLSLDLLTHRKHAWEEAYRTTPHGDPVVLQGA